MDTLLVAATEFEISPFIATQHPNVDILITGIGVPNTLYNIQNAIKNNDYQLIIQAGIGGSFITTTPLATVFEIEKDVFADIGFSQNKIFTPLHQSKFANKNDFPFTNGWLLNTTKCTTKIALQKVTAITVNTVTDNIDTINELTTLYQAQIESMEGAALHFVCLQQAIPFMQLRSVSNYVGERNKNNWKIKEAIAALNQTLQQLLLK
jgi:futalosine hydrolase